MTTAAPAISTSRFLASLSKWINRALEALWLLLVVLVPLTFIDRDYAVSEAVIAYLEVPKVALLRTLAGVMAALWLMEWSIYGRFSAWTWINSHLESLPSFSMMTGLFSWLQERPVRLVMLAVWFFLGSTILSTLFSGSIKTSLWGEIPGQDGFAAYTVAGYFLVCGIIATHLKTRGQLWRLLAAFAGMGTLAAGYAICQHFGYDFLELTEQTGGGGGRATSFMGNAIFAGAVMSMTIPITLGIAAASFREPVWRGRRFRSDALNLAQGLLATTLWSALLAVQLLGIIFTFSRGPMVGGLAAVVSFLILSLVFLGWRVFGRGAVILGLALALAFGFLYAMGSVSILNQGRWFGALIAVGGILGAGTVMANWRIFGRLALATGVILALGITIFLGPNFWGGGEGAGSAAGRTSAVGPAAEVGARFASIGTDVLRGGRGTHWRVSAELMKDRPWFEFDNLSLRWLRPLIGYGPDLFRYTYLLRSDGEGDRLIPLEPDSAHNFFIHQGVEQGIFGLLGSLGIFAAVAGASAYYLVRLGKDYSLIHKLILITLLSTLAGRFLELMVGVPRVSDLTVLWVLLGAYIALHQVMLGSKGEGERLPELPRPAGRRRNPSRQANAVTSGPYSRNLFWRLALTSWLLGGIIVLTWVQGVNHARAAVAEGTAVRFFKQGDWQASLASLGQAIKLAPDVPTYHNNRAKLYLAYQLSINAPFERRCNRQSEVLYDVCLALDGHASNLEAVIKSPFYYRSRGALGNSAFNLGLDERAIESFQVAAGLVPGSWEMKNNLVVAILDGEHSEDALEVLEEALAITGESKLSDISTFLQGKVYQDLGQLDKAAQSMTQSLAFGLSGNRAAQAHLVLGKHSIASGLFREAINHLNQAVTAVPPSPLAYSLRGQEFARGNRYQEASRDFEKAIELGSELESDTLDLGISYFELGGNIQAINYLDQAVSIDPQSGKALAYRGKASTELGRHERGFQDLNQAIRLSPQDSDTHYLRGSAYLDLGQYQPALQDLDEAIRLAPLEPKQFVARGDTLVALGRLDQAAYDYSIAVQLRSDAVRPAPGVPLDSLDEAVRRNPLNTGAYAERGLAYYSLGQHLKAISDLDEAIRLEPRNSIPIINRGMAHIGLGRYDEAIEDFNLVIAHLGFLSPDSPAFFLRFYGKGLAHFNVGNYEQAVKDQTDAIEQSSYPGFAEAHIIRGISYGQMGQVDLAFKDLAPFVNAIEDLDRGFNLNPERSQVYYTRGLAFLHLSQYMRSIAYFDQAISLDPQDSLAPEARRLAHSLLAGK